MHTTCPECSSVFRVTAEQLNVAHGQVRCGYCQTVFDALGSLEDDWKDSLPGHEQTEEDSGHVLSSDYDARNAEDGVNGETSGHSLIEQDDEVLLDELLSDKDNDAPQPTGPILAEDEPSALAELQAGNTGTVYAEDVDFHQHEPADIKQQVETLFGKLQDQIHHEVVGQSSDAQRTNIEHEATPEQADVDMEEIIAEDHDISDYVLEEEIVTQDQVEQTPADAPHILREELAAITAQQGNKYTFAWFAGIVFLVALLLLQGLYYFRDELAKHESYRGLVVSMCKLMACEVPLRNDAQQGIKTIVMRSHAINTVAGQDDQLQIKTVFTNTAAYAQAYPQLSIKMTDESGKVTAMRRFLPDEYLGTHIDIEQGLPAQTSVEVIFAIIKPQTPVISYQLDFL